MVKPGRQKFVNTSFQILDTQQINFNLIHFQYMKLSVICQGSMLWKCLGATGDRSFHLWATGKSYVFHINLSAGHQGFHG